MTYFEAVQTLRRFAEGEAVNADDVQSAALAVTPVSGEAMGYSNPWFVTCPNCGGDLTDEGPNSYRTRRFVVCGGTCGACWLVHATPPTADETVLHALQIIENHRFSQALRAEALAMLCTLVTLHVGGWEAYLRSDDKIVLDPEVRRRLSVISPDSDELRVGIDATLNVFK